MADAAAGVAPAQGTPTPPNGAPTPKPGETPAQAARRFKMDLGDGEREYTEEAIRADVGRGKKAAHTLSLAEKRAQDAAKKEQDSEARFADLRSKDPKRIRAALKALEVDERALANDVGAELLEDMELEKDPVRKRLREAERKLQAVDDEKAKSAESEKKKQAEAETERHKEELGELFVSVMEKAKLPRESAASVFPRIAQLYAAVEGSGGKVDPDLAAERVRTALNAEHRALYYKPDGKGGQSLNVEAIKEMLGPEAFAEIRRAAVAEYRSQKAGGAAPPPTPAPRQPQEERPVGRGNFWKTIDNRYK